MRTSDGVTSGRSASCRLDLSRQQLEGFHHGRLEPLESVKRGGFRPRGEDAVAQVQILGIEVAHAARRFELHKY
jgi:hypothetical protein